MTTSDERRKVAELMRNEAADFRRIGEEYGDAWTVDLGDVPAIFQDITHYMGLDGVVRNDVIFDRIADLIDPTCHADTSCEWRCLEIGCRCSVCNAPLAYGVRHCDNCGARVVYDD